MNSSTERLVRLLGLAAIGVVAAFAFVSRKERETPIELSHVLPGIELSSIPGVSIQRAMAFGLPRIQCGSDSLKAKNASIEDLLGHAFPVPEGGLCVRAKLRETMVDFSAQLAKALKAPVFDETGMEGSYDAETHWNSSPGNTLIAVLKNRGLELQPTKRPLKQLVISKAHID